MIGIGIVLGIILVVVLCCVMCVKSYQSRQLNGVKNREVNEMRKLKSQVEKKTKSGKSEFSFHNFFYRILSYNAVAANFKIQNVFQSF